MDEPTAGAAHYPSTIAAALEHELVVKKSRFIAQVTPARTTEEAEAVIAAVRKHYWDARHHCVALVIGTHADQQRSSDGGEPSGTAGVPMLEVLRRRDLTDLVTVVTRYFGGVKLGAGGLVRAYSTAVSEALDLARVVRRTPAVRVEVEVPHQDAGRIQGVLREWVDTGDAQITDVTYLASATITLLVPPSRLGDLDAALAAASAGRLTAVRGDIVVMER
ncbi:YigZ family protein [Kineosporia sp. NBRC 101731]|uniref:IMPACT family protein n=1 Tax=Kineosporia sp. NBRC 101731 TaxID=3032199 RepID=UPI0024A4F978|nr:YigZ family protein [Kineosporia sp. NBRC 101731]GLY32292.1 YigZ family protein [Kineosporia sp. NBRC 101731]